MEGYLHFECVFKKSISISACYSLKVHKNENFFGFDFEFCTFSVFVMQNNKILVNIFFDWTIMGGAMIITRSLKSTRNEKNLQDRPKFFFIF
jgi:hypothetical protein